MSHRCVLLFAVGLLPCSTPNERAFGGGVRDGQVNIDHEMSIVKNGYAHFRCLSFACAAVSLHIAPTEIERVGYSKSDAETVLPGSNARPFCEVLTVYSAALARQLRPE